MAWKEQKNANFHSRNAEINNEEFQKRVLALRNEDYLAKIDEVRDGLNFTGRMSDVEMEVLFIRTAERKFSQGSSLKVSIKRDIFLMSLGLLREFSQYKDKEERRLRFVQESDYIATYNYGKYASYSEDEITESIKKDMVIALRKAEDRALKEIAKILYEKKDCSEYSESLSKYYECNSRNSDRIPDNELPSLRHPRSSIDKTIELPAVIANGQDEQKWKTNGSDPSVHKRKKKPQRSKKKKKGKKPIKLIKIINIFNIKIEYVAKKKQFYRPLIAVFLVSMGVSIQFTFNFMQSSSNENEQTVENSPEIEEIYVFNNPISLPAGQSDEIVVKCLPIGADKNELNCISDNTDIATVEDLIVTAKEWQEGNNTTKVFIGSTNAQKVDVDIIVEPPDPADKPKRSMATSDNISYDSDSDEHE